MFDLAVGVLGIPLHIYYLANAIGGISSCLAASIAHCLTIVPIEVSTSILAAMTLKRYIAVIHPYFYKVQVTKKRILIIIGFITAVDFFVVTLSVVILPLIEIYATVKLIFIFLLTTYVYTRIYLVVRGLASSQRKPNGGRSPEWGNFEHFKLENRKKWANFLKHLLKVCMAKERPRRYLQKMV